MTKREADLSKKPAPIPCGLKDCKKPLIEPQLKTEGAKNRNSYGALHQSDGYMPTWVFACGCGNWTRWERAALG
jgi:hypothetical protein